MLCRHQAELALESASIVPPLLRLPAEWSGTAGDLLEQLVPLVGEKVAKREDWPANPRALSGQLRRLAPDLGSIDIQVTFAPRDRAAADDHHLASGRGGRATVTCVTTVTGDRAAPRRQ